LFPAGNDCEDNIDESRVSDKVTKNPVAKVCRENLSKNAIIVGDCPNNPKHRLKIQVKYNLVIIVTLILNN